MNIRHIYLLLIAGLLLFSNPLYASNKNALGITLKATKQQAKSSEVTVVITNMTAKSINVLKWNTPLETTLSANIFNIYSNGKKMAYKGRLIKRGKPQKDDYLLLLSGESVEATVQLSRYYKMQKAGTYHIEFNAALQYLETGTSKKASSEVPARTKKLKQSLDLDFTPTTSNNISQKVTPLITTCTTAQTDIINAAHDEAISMAYNASTAMNDATVPTSAERYVEWFGAANTNRHNTIKTHYTNILDALDTQTVEFDCTCTDDYYAYVYPSEPYKIYFCNAFWSADLNGTDSQAGTIIHETSHFTVVAGTDDIVYGQDGARSLAINDPASAIINADSHEYFSENSPILSMDVDVVPPEPQSDDYGNTINEAYTLVYSPELNISGVIETGSDTDMFAITLPTDMTIFITSTGTLDTIGTLYDKDGTVIASNDDYIDESNDLNFGIRQHLQKGKYFISVDSYGSATGSYVLHLFSKENNNIVPVIIYLLQ